MGFDGKSLSRRNGTAAARLRPDVAFRLSFWLFSLFPRPIWLLYRRRVTLTWQPWSRTSVLICTILLAGCYPLPKIGIKRRSCASIRVGAAFHAVRHEMPSGRRSRARQRPWGMDGRYHNLGWRGWIQWMGGKPKEGCRDASAADQRPDGKTPDHSYSLPCISQSHVAPCVLRRSPLVWRWRAAFVAVAARGRKLLSGSWAKCLATDSTSSIEQLWLGRGVCFSARTHHRGSDASSFIFYRESIAIATTARASCSNTRRTVMPALPEFRPSKPESSRGYWGRTLL